MLYNIYINKEHVGNGLSRGELSSWLKDLYYELDYVQRISFLFDLGVNSVYELDYKELKLPLKVMHGNDILEITEDEF